MKTKKNPFELHAKARTDIGKGASRRLRRSTREGMVPAIIYGAKEAPVMITLEHDKVMQSLANESFYSRILTLDIEGKKEQAILKDLQRHPYQNRVLHMDFLRIKADQEIHVDVPLHFIHGDIAPGIKVGGGQIVHFVTEVEIKCLPAYLPEFIDVDLANLELNQTIHLSDLQLPPHVKCAANLAHENENLAVVAIHEIREVVESEAPLQPVETEIITEKKVEPEAGEGASEGKSKGKEKE